MNDKIKNRDLIIVDWIMSNDVDFIALVDCLGLDNAISALRIIL